MLGPVEIVDELGSTNQVLLARASAGAPAGRVLVADHQTHGRGRLDRRWEAAPGASLLVSVLLRPDIDPSGAHLLTFAAGLAAGDACERTCGIRPELKWPNDLVVPSPAGAYRKLAGLLAEATIDGGRLTAVVVGMGLNLHAGPHLPVDAVALDELGVRAPTRDELLTAWLEEFDSRLMSLQPAPLLGEYRQRCGTIGRTVTVDLGDHQVTGRAVDVDDDGRLVVDVGGTLQPFAVGDVVHARAFAPWPDGSRCSDA